MQNETHVGATYKSRHMINEDARLGAVWGGGRTDGLTGPAVNMYPSVAKPGSGSDISGAYQARTAVSTRGLQKLEGVCSHWRHCRERYCQIRLMGLLITILDSHVDTSLMNYPPYVGSELGWLSRIDV